MHKQMIQPASSVSASARPPGGSLARLFAPVDIVPLVCLRIIFGAVMLWEVGRYFTYGWIENYFIRPTFHFTYYGFDWVQPLPGEGMYLVFIALGVLAIAIMLGLLFRISAILFFLTFSYVFLLDAARYLNHFYLIALLSFLLIFLPAHRRWSLDSWLRPALHTYTAPAWTLWLLRVQIGLVYFFGGVAKLNGDWLRGEPMRMWLARRTDFPVLGGFFTEEWMVYLFSYGGLLLDLLLFPALLWRRSRPFALAAALGFHLLNAELFSIGIFPWLMIGVTFLLFLPPAAFRWPKLLLRTAPIQTEPPSSAGADEHGLRPFQRLTLLALGAYLAFQLFMPLRHFLYPGDVNWTEQGHRFAWHMKLRDKQSTVQFFVTEVQTGRVFEVDPRDHLSALQVDEMASRPDMILQFSRYLAEVYRQQESAQVEVRAWALSSLNGRPPQLLIDPYVDLAVQPRSLLPAAWILPLQH